MHSCGHIHQLTISVTYLRKVKSDLSALAPLGGTEGLAGGRACFSCGYTHLYCHSAIFHKDVEVTEASTDRRMTQK